jgi:hypothetical protein
MVRTLVRKAAHEVAAVHRLLAEHGKAAVLQLDFDRQVVEAAAGYMGNEDDDIGFVYSGWAQSALPHKKLADGATWQVHTDHATLMVQPGVRPSRVGDAISVGVPYGSRARLIMIYLQKEALLNNSREVELGRTLHSWLRRLKIPVGGTGMTAVREQAERISRCRISFQIRRGDRIGLVNQNVLDTALFLEDDTAQGSLFIEKATLSQTFYDQLKKHPVPVEEKAIGELSNNSMAIDVYCFLAYRLHSLKAPTFVSWAAMHAQFGRTLPDIAKFRWYFKKTLALAMAVYPDADVDVGDRGLTLKPSRPPVSPKLVAMSAKRLKN